MNEAPLSHRSRGSRMGWGAAVVGPALLMFVIGWTPGISFTEDLGRHLLLGNIILDEGAIPDTNRLTYTCPDFPFVNHHWLFQVAVAALYERVGLNGLILLKAFGMAMALALALWAARAAMVADPESNAPQWKAALLWGAGILSAVTMGFRAHIRPELASFFAVGVLLFLFEGIRTHRGMLWKGLLWRGAVALVLLAWVNSHIYFAFGLAMVGAFALERCLIDFSMKSVARELVWFLIVSGACLLNPNGAEGLLYPFQILSNYEVNITENSTLWALWGQAVNPMLMAYPFLAGWTIWAVVVLFMRLRSAFGKEPGARREALETLRPANGLIALGALAASLSMARHVPLLALAAPAALGAIPLNPPRCLSVAAWRRQWAGAVVFVLALGVNILLVGSVVSGAFARNFPPPIGPTVFGFDAPERYEGLGELTQIYKISGPVFSDFNLGSLVEYNLYPTPGYVDNRPEAFPASFWNGEYFPAMQAPDEWDRLAERRKFNLVVLSLWDEGTPLIDHLLRHPGWALVHLDEYMGVWLRRTPENEPVIRETEWTPERLDGYVRSLSEELLALPEAPWWRRQTQAERLLFLFYGIARVSDNAQARLYLGQILQRWPEYRMARQALWLSEARWSSNSRMAEADSPITIRKSPLMKGDTP